MCDTLAVMREGAVWFAKNSDREPDEPQRVEFHAGVKGDRSGAVRCTYIEIDQVPDRHAIIVSRPSWMWGAEMGVNEKGLAIGNEAVFSRRILKRGEALLGMDLLRLALERAASAEEAAELIARLLERHGQGGPAGYRNKKFRYDNSFLIADSREIIVLETAGRDWALKRVSAWAISNSYTLGTDYDRASTSAASDFKSANEAWLMPKLSCAAQRAATNRRRIEATDAMSLSALAATLRWHARGDGFDGGSNRDVCMHAHGPLRPSATTGAMVAKLAPGEPPHVAFTATPNPCVSLFKPAGFEEAHYTAMADGIWETGAALCVQAARDPAFRAAVRASIAEQEPAILAAVELGELELAEERVREWRARIARLSAA